MQSSGIAVDDSVQNPKTTVTIPKVKQPQATVSTSNGPGIPEPTRSVWDTPLITASRESSKSTVVSESLQCQQKSDGVISTTDSEKGNLNILS